MILRDRRSTSYDLASLFRGRRNTSETWSGKIAKLHWYEVVSSASFHYWRKSRRIASALMLPTSKLRTSRRIASFLMLPPSKVEDVSQNCFFFDVIKSKSWGSLAELLRFQACRLQIDRYIGRQLQQQLPLPLHYYYNYIQIQINYATLHYTNYTPLH